MKSQNLTDNTKKTATFRSLSSTFAELELSRKGRKPLPRIPNLYAIVYVAISTIIMGYGAVFGFVGILVFYALWLPRIYYKGRFTMTPTRDVITVMLIPLLACISAVWSISPKTTIHSALEYTSVIICTIIISRTVRTEAFIKGIIIGLTIILITTLINGQAGQDPFSGTYALIGRLGSKNVVGAYAEIGIFLSVLCLFLKQSFMRRLLFSVFPLCICGISLYLSKSASSVLSLAIVFGIIITMHIITRLPRSYRFFTFAVATTCFIAITVAGMTLDWQGAVLKGVGKDSTLTGRTVLWEKGMKIGMETPILGHGFSAFWVQNYPPAEQLWYEFAIDARTGFHFHSLYVETFVELGAVGVILIALFILITCFRSVALVLRHGLVLEYVFALGISFMSLIRSFVELELIGTFGIGGGFLFFAIIPRLAAYHREQSINAEKEDVKRKLL